VLGFVTFKNWVQTAGLRLQAANMLFFITTSTLAQYSTPKFDIQGHRGARGLMPENTIPAFLIALDSGVTTLELDLAVTKDNQLVVIHNEPWKVPTICPDTSSQLEPQKEATVNIFQLNYADIKRCHCHSIIDKKFPEQQDVNAVTPLLKDLIVAVEDHVKSFTRYEVNYNMEIKSNLKGDNLYHPAPEEFAELVIKTVNEYLPMQRVYIQSFDFRILKYIHQQYPYIKLGALVENNKSIDANLAELGFIPDVYSPDWHLLNADRVKYLHTKKPTGPPPLAGRAANGNEKKLRVIPWTVNDVKDMETLKKMGVDGIITDYPNRVKILK
jgi:glycerophosphoryl diester phosphodiesterase